MIHHLDPAPERVEHLVEYFGRNMRHYHLGAQCQPSVTSVLDMLPRGPGFDRWLMKNGLDAERLRDEAAARGTRVHDAIERHLRGVSVPMLAADEQLLVKGALDWIERGAVRAFAIEQPIFVGGPAGYGGTCDLVYIAEYAIQTIDPGVMLPPGVPFVADWKTGATFHDECQFAQLAAYADALQVPHAAVLLLEPNSCLPRLVDLERGLRLFAAARDLWALLGPPPCTPAEVAA